MPRWSLLEIIQYKTLIAKILINFVQSLQENKMRLKKNLGAFAIFFPSTFAGFTISLSLSFFYFCDNNDNFCAK